MKTLQDIKKIAVLGAGTMGPGIAQVYAMGGYQVTMWTRSEATREKAKAALRAQLERRTTAELYALYQARAGKTLAGGEEKNRHRHHRPRGRYCRGPQSDSLWHPYVYRLLRWLYHIRCGHR